jgi:hypothetical protein
MKALGLAACMAKTGMMLPAAGRVDDIRERRSTAACAFEIDDNAASC